MVNVDSAEIGNYCIHNIHLQLEFRRFEDDTDLMREINTANGWILDNNIA
jgi:hypothetical protein